MADNNRKTFIGLQYPLRKTPRGTLAQSTGVDLIKADLIQLLLTNPGERVMLPDYGVPLRSLVFDMNDGDLERRARLMIETAIRRWEPRVELESIVVTSNFDPDDLAPGDDGTNREYILGIKIRFYDPQNISEVNELVLEMPLGG